MTYFLLAAGTAGVITLLFMVNHARKRREGLEQTLNELRQQRGA